VTLRRNVKHAIVVGLSLIGVLAWARRRLTQQRAIIVLMFHRILGGDDFARTNSVPGMVMRDATFDELLEHAARHAEIVQPNTADPGDGSRTARLLLTFDDGWLDNATVAFPIAARHKAPFVIFVCPGLMDSAEPFWTERAVAHSGHTPEGAGDLIESLKRLPPDERRPKLEALSARPRRAAIAIDRTMSWDDARRLRQQGVTFGSHSDAHEILTFLDPPALLDDLTRARQGVERELGTACPLMAFPNGGTSNTVAAAAKAVGHARAFTTVPRAWMKGQDPHWVPRINMWEGKVTAPSGRFSAAAFDYTVYFRPFVAWVAEASGIERFARLLWTRA
jgi:peptidoglycan/xylan/chitin deacetylase (PgdA/CDA1 family)